MGSPQVQPDGTIKYGPSSAMPTVQSNGEVSYSPRAVGTSPLSSAYAQYAQGRSAYNLASTPATIDPRLLSLTSQVSGLMDQTTANNASALQQMLLQQRMAELQYGGGGSNTAAARAQLAEQQYRNVDLARLRNENSWTQAQADRNNLAGYYNQQRDLAAKQYVLGRNTATSDATSRGAVLSNGLGDAYNAVTNQRDDAISLANRRDQESLAQFNSQATDHDIQNKYLDSLAREYGISRSQIGAGVGRGLQALGITKQQLALAYGDAKRNNNAQTVAQIEQLYDQAAKIGATSGVTGIPIIPPSSAKLMAQLNGASRSDIRGL